MGRRTSRRTYTLAALVAALGAVGMGPPMGGPSDSHGLDRADVKLTASHPGGQAGFIGLGSGDLDGDGFEDVVVGAMFDDTNGESAGAVYVAYGPVTGEVDLAAEAKLLGELPGDFAGETLEASHDLDRDGFDDLVIGAPGRAPVIQPGTPAPGQVYVSYGGPDRLSGTSELVDVADAVLIGEHPADTRGHSLDATDLDGDGWADLVIGATGYGGIFPASPSKIHVVYGGPDRFDSTTDVTAVADAGWLGEQHGANTGGRIQDAGDLDGDGNREVLIGSQLWGGSLGVAYLVYGGERHMGTSSLSTVADARFVGEMPGDIAGTALAGGGDLDGDGFDDFAVGAPRIPGTGGPGSVHLFYGGTERITGQQQVTDADATLVGQADGDATGRNVAITGDLDHNGFDDLAAGALGDDEGGEDAGAVSIVPGGQRLVGEVALSDVASVKFTGEADGDAAGRGLHATGDLNRDGRADLLISAEGHDAGAQDAGAAYGILGIAPGGKPAAGFHYEATGCVEPVANFRIDPDTAARFVPEPFEVHVDELDDAVLGVPAIECDQIAIDGQDAGRALLSDVGIRIESPDGSPGQHFYQLWQPTTNENLHARMRSLGMDNALVPDATFRVDEPLPEVTTATADIPWERMPYVVEAQTPRPVPLPPGGNTWWHHGPRGVIKIAYTFHDRELAFGTARVSTDEDSPLAELLGASERTADEGALLNFHHYEGTIELIESDLTDGRPPN